MTPEQQVLNAKLDDIYAVVLAIAQKPASATAPAEHATLASPWETPELPVSMVKVDGRTVNADGSTWTLDNSGQPMQLIYGYISQAKNPAMFDRMVRIMGEERLANTLGTDRLVRYKTNPDAVLLSGDPNAVNLSYVLSGPLPPAMPGTPPEA